MRSLVRKPMLDFVRPTARPAAFVRAALLLGAMSATPGCGSAAPRPVGATAAKVSTGPLPAGPEPPTEGLPIPSLDAPWTPPSVVAGDPGGLAEELQKHAAVAVRGGTAWAGEAGQAQLADVVHDLAPDVSVHRTASGSVRALLAEPTELTPRRLDEAGPAGPRYAADAIALRTDWNEGREVTGDAPVVLAIDEAPIDPQAWARLPAHTVGGCGEVLDALATGQEQSLAWLEPFLDHADAVLWRVYSAELRARVPKLRAALQPHAAERTRQQVGNAAAWRTHVCGHAYWEQLQPYLACGDEPRSCPMAPRLYLFGGARIGTAEPTVFVPEDCPNVMGVDVVDELREAGREAARVAREHLDPDWIALADRLGTITETYAALEDVCTPRRRRFAPADLQAARDRLARIGHALASDELDHPGATWRFVHDTFHVPSVGPVVQLAQYDAGPGSPAREVVAQSRALRQFVLGRAQCRGGRGERPLAVMVAQADAPKPAWLGFFLEEELVCADLGPRQ